MRVEAKQTSVFEVIRWLSSDACHDLDDADMISVLGRRLQSLGFNLRAYRRDEATSQMEARRYQ